MAENRIVAQLLKSSEGLISMIDEYERTALHYAVIHDQKKVVEILIQAGANVNSLDIVSRTPISFAAEKGLVKCTRLLLSKDANINLEEIENEDERKEKKTPVQLAAENGHSEIVQILAKERQADLTRTYEGSNCLDIAIDKKHVDTVSTIIKTDQWENLLRNHTQEFQSPMRKLIKNMPDAAKVVFDRCTEVSGSDKTFSVEFNYEFLDDTLLLNNWNKEGENANISERKPYTGDTVLIKNNHPLMLMVTSERKELLDHPLVSALLKKKWTSVGLFCHVLNFMLYVLYLATLTGFALDINAPFQFTNLAPGGDICSKDNATDYKIPEFAAAAKYLVIIIASIELFIEILEIKLMFSCKVWLYVMEIENVLEWITCITSILFVLNTSGCSDTGYRPQWQWTCGIISVFLAWINLLFLIQKFEWVGIYVVMLYRIVKVFVKFFLVFSLLIVAFAVSFHCLFQNQEHFGTFWISLVKTTAMMIGELDFNTTFLDGEVHFDFISYVFFYGFMLFMSIVVINLLVGLAVENIQEFHTRAGLAKKEMQVKYALELERLSTSSIFRKVLAFLFCNGNEGTCMKVETKETLKPNKQNWLQKKFGQSWKLTERDIKAALNTEKEGISREIARLDTKMKTMETKLKANQKTMDSKLMAILNNLKNLEDIMIRDD